VPRDARKCSGLLTDLFSLDRVFAPLATHLPVVLSAVASLTSAAGINAVVAGDLSKSRPSEDLQSGPPTPPVVGSGLGCALQMVVDTLEALYKDSDPLCRMFIFCISMFAHFVPYSTRFNVRSKLAKLWTRGVDTLPPFCYDAITNNF
jgi:hypothetical protein